MAQIFTDFPTDYFFNYYRKNNTATQIKICVLNLRESVTSVAKKRMSSYSMDFNYLDFAGVLVGVVLLGVSFLAVTVFDTVSTTTFFTSAAGSCFTSCFSKDST